MYGYQGRTVRAGSAKRAVKFFCRRASFIEKSAANNSIFRLFRARGRDYRFISNRFFGKGCSARARARRNSVMGR